MEKNLRCWGAGAKRDENLNLEGKISLEIQNKKWERAWGGGGHQKSFKGEASPSIYADWVKGG